MGKGKGKSEDESSTVSVEIEDENGDEQSNEHADLIISRAAAPFSNVAVNGSSVSVHVLPENLRKTAEQHIGNLNALLTLYSKLKLNDPRKIEVAKDIEKTIHKSEYEVTAALKKYHQGTAIGGMAAATVMGFMEFSSAAKAPRNRNDSINTTPPASLISIAIAVALGPAALWLLLENLNPVIVIYLCANSAYFFYIAAELLRYKITEGRFPDREEWAAICKDANDIETKCRGSVMMWMIGYMVAVYFFLNSLVAQLVCVFLGDILGVSIDFLKTALPALLNGKLTPAQFKFDLLVLLLVIGTGAPSWLAVSWMPNPFQSIDLSSDGESDQASFTPWRFLQATTIGILYSLYFLLYYHGVDKIFNAVKNCGEKTTQPTRAGYKEIKNGAFSAQQQMWELPGSSGSINGDPTRTSIEKVSLLGASC